LARKRQTQRATTAPAERGILDVLRRAHAGEAPAVHRAVLAAGYCVGNNYVVGSTDEVAAFLGVSERRVQQLVKKGMPRTQLAGKPVRFTYDLRAIVAWRLDSMASGDKKSDSDNLERLRNAKARREELSLAKDLKAVIPREQAEAVFMAAAGTFRRFGDLLQKQFGRAALELWDEHLTDAARQIEDGLGNEK